MYGIVGGEVQSTALLPFDGPACDKIAHIDHVTEFTDILTGLDALEELLCLFIERIQTYPGTFQTEI